MRIASTIAALLLLSACSSTSGVTTPPPTDRVAVAPSTTLSESESATTSTSAATGSIDDASVALVPIATANAPITGVLNPSTNEVWIGERGGTIRILEGSELSAAILDLTSRTRTDGERGLLGMAFSPAGDRLYVHYSDLNGDTVISEFPVDADQSVGVERIVLQVAQPFGNHNGGDILLGPDGYLYVALGDGGSGGDPEGNGQDTTTLLGSILRIDPSSGNPYAIPDTNPFADDSAARPEIWAYGVRNPFRISFDSDGALWVADVGQNKFEEITRIDAGVVGANLGWNLMEGDETFDGAEPAGHVGPVLTYPHDGRCSITGGLVYRGSAIPDLVGSYLYSDFCDTAIRAFEIDDPATDRSLDVAVEGSPVAFIETADGEVLVLSLSGTIYLLEPLGP